MDKAVPNAAGVSTPRHALPDGPLQPAGDGSEVRVAEALVAHFGRPMVVNAHRRGRSQFLVTITLGDCNEYGNPREPELLRLLVDTLHHEVVAGLIALEVAWVDQDSHSVVALMSAPGAARLRARVGDICRTLTGTSWCSMTGRCTGSCWVPAIRGSAARSHGRRSTRLSRRRSARHGVRWRAATWSAWAHSVRARRGGGCRPGYGCRSRFSSRCR